MPPHQPNFWDFVNSFDPSRASGQGVDHQTPPPWGGAFFPFGGPGPRHPPHGPPPGAWPWGADAAAADDVDGEWNPWAHHGGPWGRRGWRHGRRHHHQQQHQHQQTDHDESGNERDDSPATMTADEAAANAAAAPDPAEVAPEEAETQQHQQHQHQNRAGPGRHGGPGRCGRGGGGPHRRGGPYRGHAHGHGHGHAHRGGPHHPPPPPPYPGFDLQGLMRALGSHPLVQNLREFIPDPQSGGHQARGAASADDDDVDAFAPPVDVFNTPTAYVLHVALPGARKEDVGVSWDADARQVRVAGVVHRPGDEAFLATLQGSGERRVGLFERLVSLPGEGPDADEVEAMSISAKMEDGVLIVTIPKAPRDEKEWTEIHKVDIE